MSGRWDGRGEGRAVGVSGRDVTTEAGKTLTTMSMENNSRDADRGEVGKLGGTGGGMRGGGGFRGRGDGGAGDLPSDASGSHQAPLPGVTTFAGEVGGVGVGRSGYPSRAAAPPGPLGGASGVVAGGDHPVTGSSDDSGATRRVGEHRSRRGLRRRPASMYNIGSHDTRSRGIKRALSSMDDDPFTSVASGSEVIGGQQGQQQQQQQPGHRQQNPMQPRQSFPQPIHPSPMQQGGMMRGGPGQQMGQGGGGQGPQQPPSRLPPLPHMNPPQDPSPQPQLSPNPNHNVCQHIHNYYFHAPVTIYQGTGAESTTIATQHGTFDTVHMPPRGHPPGGGPHQPPHGGGGFQAPMPGLPPMPPPPPHNLQQQQRPPTHSPSLERSGLSGHHHQRHDEEDSSHRYHHENNNVERLPPILEPPTKRRHQRVPGSDFQTPSLSMPNIAGQTHMSKSRPPINDRTPTIHNARSDFRNVTQMTLQQSQEHENNMNDWEFVVDMYQQGIGTPDGRPLKEHSKSEGVFADRKLLEKRRTIGKTYEKLGKELFENAIGYKVDEVSGERKKQRMYHVIARCRAVNAIRKAGGDIPTDSVALDRLLDAHLRRKKEMKYSAR